jgi:hypothetical protein
MGVEDEDDEWLGPDVSVYGAGAVDPNLEDVKGNLEIEFEAWGEDLGRLIIMPRDEFTKAAFNLLTTINKAVNGEHDKMTGAAVNDRQNAFRICWKAYVDKSRKAQPTANKERAFLLAKARRTDRIEYCKLEIAGKALAKWAYLADSNYGDPKPKFFVPPSCFMDGVIISMDPNATSKSMIPSVVLTPFKPVEASTPTKKDLKDEAMVQPKLQISEDTQKEAEGQLKLPTNDEHQFHLDQMAIKDLKDGLNVMVDNDNEERMLHGFRKCNQVFEVDVYQARSDHVCRTRDPGCRSGSRVINRSCDRTFLSNTSFCICNYKLVQSKV